MQNKITFAPVEPYIDEVFTIGLRKCKIARNNGITCLSIEALNFLNKPMGTLFQCTSVDYKKAYTIYNLEQLSQSKLKEFARHVVQVYEERIATWEKHKSELFKVAIREFNI